MMEDIEINDSGLIGELDDGLEDLEDFISDISDEDASDSEDVNDDNNQLVFSADEEENDDDESGMDENEDSVDGDEQLPLDNAASWELECLQALTGIIILTIYTKV
jgi:hypothetical protein